MEPRPGTNPLGCNVLEAMITLTCTIDGTSVTIRWGFTTNSEEAGMSEHELDPANDRYIFTTDFDVDSASAFLTIREFDNSYNGFYWCVVTNVGTEVGAGSPNPSHVLNLTAQHSTDELPPCEEVVEFAGTGERCAWGPPDSQLAIIETVEFTNVTIALPTTNPVDNFTQSLPTTIDTVMTEEHDTMANGKMRIKISLI